MSLGHPFLVFWTHTHFKYRQWFKGILQDVKIWSNVKRLIHLCDYTDKCEARGGCQPKADAENFPRLELTGDFLTWIRHCLQPRSRFNVCGRRYVGLQDFYGQSLRDPKCNQEVNGAKPSETSYVFDIFKSKTKPQYWWSRYILQLNNSALFWRKNTKRKIAIYYDVWYSIY